MLYPAHTLVARYVSTLAAVGKPEAWAETAAATSGERPRPFALPLAALPPLYSSCMRQASRQIAALVVDLAGTGLRLHGFGVKTRGLGMYAADLTSADPGGLHPLNCC
jgi:hypothetical protein